MRPVATDVARSVVCVYVCVDVLCKKRLNWSRCRWVGLNLVGPRNHYQMGVKIGRINSQPRGVRSRRCGLLSNYFIHLFMVTTTYTTVE